MIYQHAAPVPLATTEQTREAERRALAVEPPGSDATMLKAARAVAEVAQQMLDGGDAVLVLAGPGGNGGDGLYAGAYLTALGVRVQALIIAGHAHERALLSFRERGGSVVDSVEAGLRATPALVIDAIAGLGANRPAPSDIQEALRKTEVPVLAIDSPTPGLRTDHIVTFDRLRVEHLDYPDVPITVRSIGLLFPPATIYLGQAWPEAHLPELDVEPQAESNKFTGGVVGLRAGSEEYPGAGVLCTLAATRATPSMVRAIDSPREIITAVPEAVRVEGPVDAWVVGPGRTPSEEEVSQALARPEPLLLDATALTVVAASPDLRAALRERASRGEHTILTPHEGEFRRLMPSFPRNPTSAQRVEAALALAAELRCSVLLKGRDSILVEESHVHIIDAGTSWAATPGSGDVLAGLLGAFLAAGIPLVYGLVVHGVATALAATTPYGMAPTTASQIAEKIPAAIAFVRNGPAGEEGDEGQA